MKALRSFDPDASPPSSAEPSNTAGAARLPQRDRLQLGPCNLGPDFTEEMEFLQAKDQRLTKADRHD